MQKHSFESWIFTGSLILAALIVFPQTAEAATLTDAASSLISAKVLTTAMFAVFIGIKVFPNNGRHF